MRRRLFQKDSTSQSLCIFCSYRFLTRSHYIPRRTLHTSPALSKPPGSASAPRNSKNDGETNSSQSRTGNGSPQDSKASTVGAKPQFATPAPNFGRNPTFGGNGLSFGSSKPTFGVNGPTFASSKPTFGASQPTFGMGAPSFGVSKPVNGLGSGMGGNNQQNSGFSPRSNPKPAAPPRSLEREQNLAPPSSGASNPMNGVAQGNRSNSEVHFSSSVPPTSQPRNMVREQNFRTPRPSITQTFEPKAPESGANPTLRTIRQPTSSPRETAPESDIRPVFGSRTQGSGATQNFNAQTREIINRERTTSPREITPRPVAPFNSEFKPGDSMQRMITPTPTLPNQESRPPSEARPSAFGDLNATFRPNPGSEPVLNLPTNPKTSGDDEFRNLTVQERYARARARATSLSDDSYQETSSATKNHSIIDKNNPEQKKAWSTFDAIRRLTQDKPSTETAPTPTPAPTPAPAPTPTPTSAENASVGPKPAFGGMSSATKPSFGISGGAKAAPTFGINPGFGAKPTFGASSSNSGFQMSEEEKEFRAALERQAKENLEKMAIQAEPVLDPRPRIPVEVFGEPHPESTRAGRPTPRLVIPPSEARERAQQAFMFRNPEPGVWRIQPGSTNDTDHGNKIYDKSESWTHLNKQRTELPPSQDSGHDAFQKARADREKQAESGRYVPLMARSSPVPNREDSQRFRSLNKGSNVSESDFKISYQRGQSLEQGDGPQPDRPYFKFGQTGVPNARETARESWFAQRNSYGQNGSSNIRNERSYDPYSPREQDSVPLSPGDWRDEIPRRDDRLRRRNTDPASTNTNERNESASRTSRSVSDSQSRLQQRLSQDTQPTNYQPQGPSSSGFGDPESHRLTAQERYARAKERAASLRSDPLQGSSHAGDGSESSTPAEKPRRDGIGDSKRETGDRVETADPEISTRSEGRRRAARNNDYDRDDDEVSARSERGRKSGRSRSSYDDLPKPKGKDKDKARRRGKFVDSFDEVEESEAVKKLEERERRKAEKAAKKAAAAAARTLTPILLPEWISAVNLAAALHVKLDDFHEKLEELGYVDMNNDFILGAEDAGLIAQEYGFEPIVDRNQESDDLKARPPPEDVSVLPPRPPVVTIMGHVDHGKTTLLDWLRKSSIVQSEHGGITQHIGAFSVPMPSGKIITFLDTPGHEAFLSMRQRGANVTDIVILVVAADDSVKPQTIEAINHAKSAKVPIIVAISKVDKPEADAERVKNDLVRHGIEVEDIGGETQAVCVSGITGEGMEDLEESIVTLSEILDMRAERDGNAEGWVIEASLKSMGKVATVLVKRGTMRPGDFIVAGKTWAKIRCMRNEAGIEIEEAGPGTPVEIDGWREQPLAGDEVLQAPNEDRAKRAVEYRLEREEREKLAADMEVINENRRLEQEKREREKREAAIAAGELPEEELPTEEEQSSDPSIKEVYLIVKADVSGSVEAVTDSINALGTNEVRARILRSGVGQLTEFDVEYAAAAKGSLIAFNREVDPMISGLAAKAGVPILSHNIIYKLVDEVKAKMSELLPPIISHTVTGEADILQIFDINIKGRKYKPIAGCKVKNGVINKASKVRVLRDGEKIFDGTLASLKNVKKDVTEMRKGSECGIGFEDWTDFQVGDQIQCYEVIETKRYL